MYNVIDSGISNFGLFNFFIQLRLPSEKLLNGIKIASVTQMNHSQHFIWQYPSELFGREVNSKNNISYIKTKNNNNRNGPLDARDGPFFVPFTDIYSSHMGVIGFDINRLSFLNSTSKMSKDTKDYFGSDNLSPIAPNESEQVVNELWLIPMTPERMGVKYHKSNNEMYNCI